MARVISVHEYELPRGVEAAEFAAAIAAARERGLFDVSGLMAVHFARTLRTRRRQTYAAMWVYESREAWDALWKSSGQPDPEDARTGAWPEWESDILARILDHEPNTISYTAYEEL
jgi:hypothetical protein